MNIEVVKMRELHDRTLSMMRINGEDCCWVLEDGYRETKVPGETRIPAGRYEIVRRTEGSFYQKYRKEYLHDFSLHIKDVPGFEQILIHIGNTPNDTRGCLLVGLDASFETTNGTIFIRRSTEAYKRLYNVVANAFSRGNKVFIDIKR